MHEVQQRAVHSIYWNAKANKDMKPAARTAAQPTRDCKQHMAFSCRQSCCKKCRIQTSSHARTKPISAMPGARQHAPEIWLSIRTGSAYDVEEAEIYSILLAKVCLLEYPSMSVTTTEAYSPGFGAPFARRLLSSSLQCSNTTQSNNFCDHKIYQCIISSLSCDLTAYHLVSHGLVAASHLTCAGM